MAETVEERVDGRLTLVPSSRTTQKLGNLDKHYTEQARLIRAIIHVERERANDDLVISFDRRESLDQEIAKLRQQLLDAGFNEKTMVSLERRNSDLEQSLASARQDREVWQNEVRSKNNSDLFLRAFAAAVRKAAPATYKKAKEAASRECGITPTAIGLR